MFGKKKEPLLKRPPGAGSEWNALLLVLVDRFGIAEQKLMDDIYEQVLKPMQGKRVAALPNEAQVTGARKLIERASGPEEAAEEVVAWLKPIIRDEKVAEIRTSLEGPMQKIVHAEKG